MRFGLIECLLGTVVICAMATWLSVWLGFGWLVAILTYSFVGSVTLLVSTIVLAPGRDRSGANSPGRFQKKMVVSA